MKNKILVKLSVPELDETYDVYIPISKKIGNVIILLDKALVELSDGIYISNPNRSLYDSNGNQYNYNQLVLNSGIKNGMKVILM